MTLDDWIGLQNLRLENNPDVLFIYSYKSLALTFKSIYVRKYYWENTARLLNSKNRHIIIKCLIWQSQWVIILPQLLLVEIQNKPKPKKPRFLSMMSHTDFYPFYQIHCTVSLHILKLNHCYDKMPNLIWVGLWESAQHSMRQILIICRKSR